MTFSRSGCLNLASTPTDALSQAASHRHQPGSVRYLSFFAALNNFFSFLSVKSYYQYQAPSELVGAPIQRWLR